MTDESSSSGGDDESLDLDEDASGFQFGAGVDEGAADEGDAGDEGTADAGEDGGDHAGGEGGDNVGSDKGADAASDRAKLDSEEDPEWLVRQDADGTGGAGDDDPASPGAGSSDGASSTAGWDPAADDEGAAEQEETAEWDPATEDPTVEVDVTGEGEPTVRTVDDEPHDESDEERNAEREHPETDGEVAEAGTEQVARTVQRSTEEAEDEAPDPGEDDEERGKSMLELDRELEEMAGEESGDGVAVSGEDETNPGAAAVLSFLLPGLGNLYNGQAGRGLVWLVAWVAWLVVGWGVGGFFFGILLGVATYGVMFVLTAVVLLVVEGLVHFVAAYDAYNQGERINEGTVSV